MTGDIVVTFIVPKECKNEDECSEDMQQAFLACEQHCGLKAEWIHESEFKKFEGLTKEDIFVLSEFQGEMYERLRSTKCLLLGPRCLSCCLTEGTSIPRGVEPVYTIAMRGLSVTASGLTKEKKENIKKKVFWMGGFYSTVLSDTTTHLVSDTVISDKYIKSVEKRIPVMAESWVEAVWSASLTQNINGSSPDFKSHLLPPFANLQVTTSSITKMEKQLITKLVNGNGGNYSGAFHSETTDVVVMNKEGVGSEKYKAAIDYGKAIVVPKWVVDSAEQGIALPFNNYKVIGASTSSPLSETRLPDMSLNFSRISNLKPRNNFVDETTSTNMSTMSGKVKISQDTKRSSDPSNIDKDVSAAFESLDMSAIKKAGPIFDGFCIWVCGLEGICRDRGVACVSRCGGVRYEAAHPRVTHAVAGNLQAATQISKELPNVPVLSPIWLVKSVEAGRALDEAEFLIDLRPSTPAKSTSRKQQIESASPMSKRNLQLLRRVPLDLPPPTSEVVEPQDDLVNHYLSQNLEPLKEKTPERALPIEKDTTKQQEPNDITEDPTEEIEQIFRGIKIEVQGLDEEAITEIGVEVAAAGGVLSAAGAGGTHVLVPLDFDPEEMITKDAEPITVFWVKDCLCQQELVAIEYYHRPVKVPNWGCEPGPLNGVVASLSTYSGIERAFIDELAKLLGATTQLRFCRRNTPNALASTHLICPSPVGDKYLGAVKWNLPAVKASWLMECVEKGRRVSEGPHLVGDTKAPLSHVEAIREEAEPQSVVEQANNRTDKENEMLPPADCKVPRRDSVPNGENTPKYGDNEMSPASRYIAMARQGLLGSDSQETPKRVNQLKEDAQQDGEEVRTPPLEDALSTPNLSCLSPTTRRRLQAVKRGEMPSDPIRTPTDPFQKNIETPDSGFGAALRPGSGRMSPDARKQLWKVVNSLPSKQPEPIRDRQTPLSEIRNRFLAQFNGGAAPTPPSDHTVAPRKLHLQEPLDTPPAKMAKLSADQSAGAINMVDDDQEIKEKSDSSASSAQSVLPAAVDVQLQRLNAALTSRLSSQRSRRMTRESVSAPPQPESEPAPESQPNTIGWDDTTPAHQQVPLAHRTLKRFMLSSNVDNREEIIEMVLHLGGAISDGAELDVAATHLLCAAPGRSEKMLGSVAAGKWVLHPAYVARSGAANRFLPEEEYEWGNPVATCLPPLSGNERVLALAAYRWRSARAEGRAGPFKGVVALLHVPQPRKKLLARLVTAGDGEAPDDEPPYNNETVTVCFADVKRLPLSSRDAAWLVSRRIPVCAPVLLSSFLTEDPPPKPEEHCLPDFKLK
ncbi:hypothetical protein K1T71_003547 [Dendrolimus kikuchii]|uniref:Uncharacterized protein n=1 Tax=Dendrolimus kikuchii TaxID=765133 RepID=A0ACC1DDF7_9NEOP|nr:hypothetical protein K1T71_003547 [Dendrolimus kikuchii]